MKKILYFTTADFKDNDFRNKTTHGVTKKIIGQLNAFKALGYKTDLIYVKDKYYFFNEEKIIKYTKWNNYNINFINQFLKNKSIRYDKVYIRHWCELPNYLPLFKKLAKISNNNIYLEIPTYPYYGEVKKTLQTQFFFLLHRIAILLTKRYIKKIVTSQDYNTIWGISTIKIVNGIDTTLINQYPTEPSYAPGDALKLIVVSNISFWHGFDRLLYGLSDYYRKRKSKRNVYITFIGEKQPETEKLMQLTQQEKLEEYVTFLPAKHGKALQEEYAKAHVGIGTLGLYRINLSYTSTLKSIEYLHQGIPFTSGYTDPKFQGKDFYHAFPNDNTPIDIHELISWRDKVKTSSEEMTRLAIEKYSWIEQMRKIVEDV